MSVLSELEKQLGITPTDFSDFISVDLEGGSTLITNSDIKSEPWMYECNYNWNKICRKLDIPKTNIQTLVNQLLNCTSNGYSIEVQDNAKQILKDIYYCNTTSADINRSIRDLNAIGRRS